MNPDNKPISLSFVEIKKSLDPACSYMIFETAVGSRESGEFREIIDVLSRLKKGVLKQEVHHDESRGYHLLCLWHSPQGVRLPKGECSKFKGRLGKDAIDNGESWQ
jgi:hypothetical protein